MKNIDEIMEMLDWNNSVEVQKEGINRAAQIEDISIFLQPIDARYNKNVWDNCAFILSLKDDEQLEPYAMEVLSWTKDLNWPGALEIIERLKKVSQSHVFLAALEKSVEEAKKAQELAWLSNLAELLTNEYFQSNLSPAICSVLEKYRGFIWD